MDETKKATDGVIIKLAETEEELKEMYKLRYKVYCVELKVFDKTNDEQMEKDEGDNHAFHYIAVLDGKIVGATRLIHVQPDGRFPMEVYCPLPDYIDKSKTLESSRTISILKDSKLSLSLLRFAYEHSLANGFKMWCFLINPKFKDFLVNKMHWNIITIGETLKYNNVPGIPAFIYLKEENFNFFYGV